MGVERERGEKDLFYSNLILFFFVIMIDTFVAFIIFLSVYVYILKEGVKVGKIKF